MYHWDLWLIKIWNPAERSRPTQPVGYYDIDYNFYTLFLYDTFNQNQQNCCFQLE